MSRPRYPSRRNPVLLLIALLSLAAGEQASKSFNGFQIERHTVPREQILPGGPRRDGIHSVDAPEFVKPQEANWVGPTTPVLGVALENEAHAYPVHIMEYHQIVNDELAGVPLAVTFDPLTATPIAYRRTVDGKKLDFGVSGLVYSSNFLLYDRETESLWSQFLGAAISGPLSGKKLARIRLRQEPFSVWLERHPQTTVLTRPEPRHIDYRYSPFSTYWVTRSIPFPVATTDDRYHPKEVMLGVEVAGRQRAYLGSILTAAGGRIVDEFEGRKIRIAYDTQINAFSWEAPEDAVVTDAYWFAWKAFHPKTEIWQDMNPLPPD